MSDQIAGSIICCRIAILLLIHNVFINTFISLFYILLNSVLTYIRSDMSFFFLTHRFLTRILFMFLFISMSDYVVSQQNPGYVIQVEGDNVYLDVNSKNSKIKPGDNLEVVKEGGYIIHPVTKEKIKKKDETISNLKISEINDEYSIAKAYPRNSIGNIVPGMQVRIVATSEKKQAFKKTIAVQPIKTVGTSGGYMGVYISDLLTERLFDSGDLKVLDRETLGWQEDEIALNINNIIDENQQMIPVKSTGVDYFIVGTLYEPDVVEVSTGIPIKAALSVAEEATGKNLGSKIASDVSIKTLVAIVKINLRVVDVESGEILFICNEMQKTEGKSQIDLERGALGGLKLQGGSSSFINTVTGKAVQQAIVNLTGYITEYFKGNITSKNYQGNIVTQGKKTDFEKKAEGGELSEFIIGDTIYFPDKKDKNYDVAYYELGKVVGIDGEQVQIKRTDNSLITKNSGSVPLYSRKPGEHIKNQIVFNNDRVTMEIAEGDTIITYFDKMHENLFVKAVVQKTNPKRNCVLAKSRYGLFSINYNSLMKQETVFSLFNNTQEKFVLIRRKDSLYPGIYNQKNQTINFSYLNEDDKIDESFVKLLGYQDVYFLSKESLLGFKY